MNISTLPPGDRGPRLLLVVVLVAVIAVRIFYHARALRNISKSTFLEGKFHIIARIAAALSGFALVITYLISPAAMSWSALALPMWLRWAGGGLGFLSVFALVWVHHALGENFSGTLHLQTDHQLVTSGPYHWVRHPMYTVFYCLSLSFFLLSANWFIGLAWFVVLTIVVVNRLPREETAMIGRFGDRYREYVARTGRFLPGL